MSVTLSHPNAPESDDSGQPTPALTPEAFGQFLVAARHHAGLSLEDVCATTKVAPRHLEALERGAIDQLPGGIYRRAWVKSYADAVGLPAEAALEQFDRMFAPAPDPAERQLTTLAPRREPAPQPPALVRVAASRARLLRWALPAAALLVAAASVTPLLRSLPIARSGGDDPQRLSRDSVAPAGATGSGGSRRSDIALVPDQIPEQPIPDPRLMIMSRPSGARVTVNGIGWGVTPITIRNLPPGRKLIRATKDGYIGRETSMELGLARSSHTVRLILQRQD